MADIDITTVPVETAIADSDELYFNDVSEIPDALNRITAANFFGTTLVAIRALADPNADRLLFWDDSGGIIEWLTLGTNLSITGTTLNASGSVSDAAYGVGWDGDTTTAPSKNAVYDKIETILGVTDGDKGDITVSSTGTVWTIDNTVVTLAKIANASANSKLLGSGDSGSGSSYSEITLGTNLSMSGTTLNATGGGTLGDGDYGDIVASGTGTVLTIDSAVVTLAKIANASANSKLLGSGASGSGSSYSEITLGTNLSMSGTTLNATGGSGGMTWTEVTGTSQSASVNNGYVANNGALVTITLPTTAAVGDIVAVTGSGAGGWKIAQNASQDIKWDAGGVDGANETTAGTGGSISSTDRYDTIEVQCITANTGWVVKHSKGVLSLV